MHCNRFVVVFRKFLWYNTDRKRESIKTEIKRKTEVIRRSERHCRINHIKCLSMSSLLPEHPTGSTQCHYHGDLLILYKPFSPLWHICNTLLIIPFRMTAALAQRLRFVFMGQRGYAAELGSCPRQPDILQVRKIFFDEYCNLSPVMI